MATEPTPAKMNRARENVRSLSAPIIERAPLPIVEVEGGGHEVTYVNAAFCALVGKSRAQLLGQSFADLVPLGHECVPVLDKVYETGEAVTYTQEDSSDANHAFWVYAMWPALNSSEQPVGVIIQLTKSITHRATVAEINSALLISGLREHEVAAETQKLNARLLQEIAERKNMEEELRSSQNETKRALDYAEATLRTAPVPLVVLRADLRVNTTNEAFCHTFRVMPFEAEGRLIYDLGNGQWNIPKLRELLEDVLPRNHVFHDFEVTHEFETIGTRTMLLNARRMENEEGEPLRIVLAIEDITERKRSDQVLRASEERYRNLFNSIDEGFCIVEMIFDEQQRPVDYRFVEVNPSFEEQSGLQNVTGKKIRELAPDHEAMWFEVFGEVARTGKPIRFMSQAKALEERWFDVYAFRIGRPERPKVAILFNNITDRKNSEEALAKAQVEISNLAIALEHKVEERTAQLRGSVGSMETLTYTLAHDLRAPLRAMRGLSTALFEDVPLDELGKKYAGRIQQAAGQMDQLVSNLLDYGQLSHLDFPTGSVDLKAELDFVLGQLKGEIEARDAEIIIGEKLPKVFGSDVLVRQILFNLLNNALKFLPPDIKPRIVIRTEIHEQMLRIWVEDNGIGIEPQYQQKIFGLFQRLHTPDEFPGTGVGLAIVKRATERMVGNLGVESDAGKGSKFWVELPTVDPGKK